MRMLIGLAALGLATAASAQMPSTATETATLPAAPATEPVVDPAMQPAQPPVTTASPSGDVTTPAPAADTTNAIMDDGDKAPNKKVKKKKADAPR